MGEGERRPQQRLSEAASPERVEGPPSLGSTTLRTWSAAGCSSPEDPKKPRLRSPERAEPTSLLNHETSDHLLSLVDGKSEDESSRIAVQGLFSFFSPLGFRASRREPPPLDMRV